MSTITMLDVVPSLLPEQQICHGHKVIALVPACNEEEAIEKTIHSLMAQTYPLECVRVIANNCTDNTVAIVERLQLEYAAIGRNEIELMVMAENKGKKSGALNYGLQTVENDIEFVFGMDGDTIVHPRIIEEGIRQFMDEPQTGGICSAYRALPLKGDSTHWERFLWRQQNIEFTLANAWRIESYKSARVLPGVSVMFRTEALKDVAVFEQLYQEKMEKAIKQLGQQKASEKKSIRQISVEAAKESKEVIVGGNFTSHGQLLVWDTTNLVEDYHLTLDLKDIGWEVKSSADMISWSDVPLRLRGKGGLWKQRERWYSGTVDEIRERRFRRHSRYEMFTISLLMLNLLTRLVLVGAYISLVLAGVPIRGVTLFLLLPLLASFTQLYRLKGGDNLDKWQIIMAGTLVTTELYAFLREIIYAYSIKLSIFNSDRGW